MIRLSQAQQNAAGQGAREQFVSALASDLRHRFPERFGFQPPAATHAHVASRIDLAMRCGVSLQRDIATLATCEAARGEDFATLPREHPVRAILESDRPAAAKVRQVNALTFALRPAAGFRPSRFD